MSNKSDRAARTESECNIYTEGGRCAISPRFSWIGTYSSELNMDVVADCSKLRTPRQERVRDQATGIKLFKIAITRPFKDFRPQCTFTTAEQQAYNELWTDTIALVDAIHNTMAAYNSCKKLARDFPEFAALLPPMQLRKLGVLS